MTAIRVSSHGPTMRLTPLAPEGFARILWKNGGGVTVDIAQERMAGASPGGWDGMIWRLGWTTIPTPGPFSDFAGHDRLQVVITGSGLVLDTPDGEIDLRTPYRPARYRGEAPIASRLENGPVEVVNLIVRRGAVEAGLDVLTDGSALDMEGGIAIAFAPAEPATLRIGGGTHALPAGHALRIDDATGRLVCETGQVVVATIRPLISATPSSRA